MIFTVIFVIILLFFGILLFDAKFPGTIPSPAIGDLGMPLFTFLRYSISSPFIDDESEVEDAGFMEKMFGSLRLDIAKAEHKKREEEEEEGDEEGDEEETQSAETIVGDEPVEQEEATPSVEPSENSPDQVETYIKNSKPIGISATSSQLSYKIY
jgi:hypothetical protein